MKTNQVLTRKMGSFNVLQRTSDGMFNATDLLRQWNDLSGQKKVIGHYFENDSTKEFLNALGDEPEFLNIGNPMFKIKRGKQGGTMMHPYVFLDYAMWLNPSFKVKVIKFVYDELIKYRNEAGDAYREMSSAISKIVSSRNLPIEIPRVSKAMNHIVFGKHETEIRNKQADEPSMRELYDLEKDIINMINRGYIKTIDQLMSHLRIIWLEKRMPKILKA
jgi:hypothetical protein